MRFSNKENAIIRHNSHENMQSMDEKALKAHHQKTQGITSGFIPAGTNVGEEEIDIYVGIWCVAIVTVVGVLIAVDGWLVIIAENAAIL